MTKWFLVRHGETAWNLERRVQGHSDTSLNDVGRVQAERVGARLTPVSFAAAYASDLRRVAETTALILQERDIPLRRIPELREKSYGAWEGMTYQEVEALNPEMFGRMFKEGSVFAPPEGESDEDIYRRVKAAAERMLANHADTDGNILVIGHGGSLRALMVCFLQMPIEYMWRFKLSNGGLSTISVFGSDGATLDLLNDTSHL